MKKLIRAEPYVDPLCKEYSDNFIEFAGTIPGIFELLGNVEHVTLVNDAILGPAVVLSYAKAEFLVYLNKDTHLLQTTANGNTYICLFANNEVCVDILRRVLLPHQKEVL